MEAFFKLVFFGSTWVGLLDKIGYQQSLYDKTRDFPEKLETE